MKQMKNGLRDSNAESPNNNDEKREKKQKLVRNDFVTVGKYGMPLFKKQNIDINKIELWGYSKAKQDDEENKQGFGR